MSDPVILVHAGAGGFGDDLRERADECRAALERALSAGAARCRRSARRSR